MKKTILAGLVAALAAGLVGCTPQPPRDAETVNLQRIQIDGEEWQKIQFTEHVYTKEEVDRIVDDLESKTITVESDPTVPDWAKAPNPPQPTVEESDPVWNAEKGNYATKAEIPVVPDMLEYVKTNHTGNVKIIGNVMEGAEDVKATGPNSHAEGVSTVASGEGSHAEGENTTASGPYSHAEGRKTVASGYYSHAEGNYTTAASHHSHSSGYNVLVTNAYAYGWSGWATGEPAPPYESHGFGTFNINPSGGATGFYIGETNLVDLINALIDARLNQ